MGTGPLGVALATLAFATTAQAAVVPGRYAVVGKSLDGQRGKAISVFPARGLVTVEGCTTLSGHLRHGRASAKVRCGHSKRRLTAKLTTASLKGTFAGGGGVHRKFTAKRGLKGVLLKGSGRAVSRLGNVDAGASHTLDLATAPGGTLIARTEVILTLKPDASVRQVDQALALVGGRIVSAVSGDDRVIVAIPDPGTVAALDRLLAALRSRPGIALAQRSPMASDEVLPPQTGSPPSSTQAAQLSHLLAARMPAAWNARGAILAAGQPTVILLDSFGNGPLSRHIDATYDHASLVRSGVFVNHGYQVAGIIAGDFANDGTSAGQVAGVFPATTRLKVLDERNFTFGEIEDDLLRAAAATSGNVVVNTSLGWTAKKDDADAILDGADWARRVRGQQLEPRMMHATAAGNLRAGTAQTNSSFAAAATRGDLRYLGAAVTPLQDTLAVESVADSGAPAFQPGCLDQPASHGGSVSAVGKDVFSLDARGRAVNGSGSSFATPIVAGLAEYLWSIAPDLSATQVANAIRLSAQPAPGACGAPRPASSIDAYAAVLSLDQAGAPTPSTAPVRLAILDTNGDHKFDATDVHALAPVVFGPASARNWSSSDLNGDGFSGGTGAVPFDLSTTGSTRAGAPSYGTVLEQVEGATRSFDEMKVTDGDILCYYAYSALYSGSPSDRDTSLSGANKCGQPIVAQTIQLDSRVGNMALEAHATAGSTTIPSDSKLFAAPSGTDPFQLNQSLTSVDADAIGGANELHTHAEGQIDAFVQPTLTGGQSMAVSGTQDATRTVVSGSGVGSATASSVVSMRVNITDVPAHLKMTSTVSGAATFRIQFNSDPLGAPQPNGTVDQMIDPGSWLFAVQCTAVADVSHASRSCTENVTVSVEPQ